MLSADKRQPEFCREQACLLNNVEGTSAFGRVGANIKFCAMLRRAADVLQMRCFGYIEHLRVRSVGMHGTASQSRAEPGRDGTARAALGHLMRPARSGGPAPSAATIMSGEWFSPARFWASPALPSLPPDLCSLPFCSHSDTAGEAGQPGFQPPRIGRRSGNEPLTAE